MGCFSFGGSCSLQVCLFSTKTCSVFKLVGQIFVEPKKRESRLMIDHGLLMLQFGDEAPTHSFFSGTSQPTSYREGTEGKSWNMQEHGGTEHNVFVSAASVLSLFLIAQIFSHCLSFMEINGLHVSYSVCLVPEFIFL